MLYIKDVGGGYIPATEKCIVSEANRISSRHLFRGEKVNNPQLVKKAITDYLHNKEVEIFSCLFLDADYQVISFQEIARLSVNPQVYIREILRRSISLNSSKVVLAQNRSLPVTEISSTDLQVTKKITETLMNIDIEVLDQVICFGNIVISFAEEGLWLKLQRNTID